MAKRVQVSVEFVDRETVENIAYIMGDSSAARKALDASKQYGDPVFFTHGGSLMVADRSSFRFDQ